jgi:hypothetical protein
LFWLRFWTSILENPPDAFFRYCHLGGKLSLWRYSFEGSQLASQQVLPNFCCERLYVCLLELLDIFNQSLRPARKQLLLSFDWLQVHGLFAFLQKWWPLEISSLLITSFWLAEVWHLDSVLIFRSQVADLNCWKRIRNHSCFLKSAQRLWDLVWWLNSRVSGSFVLQRLSHRAPWLLLRW